MDEISWWWLSTENLSKGFTSSLGLTAFGVDCDVLIGWIGKLNFKLYHSPLHPLRLDPLEIDHWTASSQLEN